jgi:hypothetical protein
VTHEKGGAFLGRGFCEDGNLNLNVSVDGTEVFDGGLYSLLMMKRLPSRGNSSNYSKMIMAKMKIMRNCLIAKSSEWLEADEPFFCRRGQLQVLLA